MKPRTAQLVVAAREAYGALGSLVSSGALHAWEKDQKAAGRNVPALIDLATRSMKSLDDALMPFVEKK